MMSENAKAGPSKLTLTEERDSRKSYRKRRKEYADLAENIQSSDELLSSLASYISTFQTDLSAVSGQVADLQQKSAGIEAQLQGRKTILPPLNALLSDITLPPALVLTIRDTQPSQNPDLWLEAVSHLDDKIRICRERGKVLAANEMESIIEGLKTKALIQLPPFLLSLIRPLRSASKGLSTNLAILQTSLLLKYQPFYSFLQHHAPQTAKQVERGYVNAARSYYETALRRYTRGLTTIKNRVANQDTVNLKYASLEGEGDVVLLYMADDKEYKVPVEGLFKSINLVLLDNASAEFTFVVRFFARPDDSPTVNGATSPFDQKIADRIWHEIFDTAMEYCDTFLQTITTYPPPAIPLLTMIRLNDRITEIAESRGTLPLIPHLQGNKLAIWPLYKKDIDRRVDEVKRLAEEAEGKGLTGFVGKGVKDSVMRATASKYAALFSCTVALSIEADETMVFAGMTRIRSEFTRLLNAQAGRIKNTNEKQSYLSTIYEVVIQGLVSGPGATTHPKLQSELSFFRTREEEARRRIGK